MTPSLSVRSSTIRPQVYLLLVTLLAFLFVSSGMAQAGRRGPDPQVQKLIKAAEKQFVGGKFKDALETYTKAYEASDAHGLLYMMARCNEQLGELEDALKLFEKFLDGDVPPEARGKATSSARLIKERLSKAVLVVQVSPFGAEVLVDDVVVGKAPLEPQEVKPGPHRVTVRMEGHGEMGQQVEALGGKRTTLVMSLGTSGSKGTTTVTTQPVTPPDPQIIGKPPKPVSYSPWTWVTLGTGSALLISGTVVYVLGELDHQKVEDAKGDPPTMTQKEAQDLEEVGDTKKLAGYLLWGVGGAAAVTASVLFILEATQEPEQQESGGVGFVPLPGGSMITVQGRF